MFGCSSISNGTCGPQQSSSFSINWRPLENRIRKHLSSARELVWLEIHFVCWSRSLGFIAPEFRVWVCVNSAGYSNRFNLKFSHYTLKKIESKIFQSFNLHLAFSRRLSSFSWSFKLWEKFFFSQTWWSEFDFGPASGSLFANYGQSLSGYFSPPKSIISAANRLFLNRSNFFSLSHHNSLGFLYIGNNSIYLSHIQSPSVNSINFFCVLPGGKQSPYAGLFLTLLPETLLSLFGFSIFSPQNFFRKCRVGHKVESTFHGSSGYRQSATITAFCPLLKWL